MSSAPLTLTKSELAEALATIWDELSKGHSESEVADLMGLDAEVYERLKTMMLDRKTDELRKRPIEHVYVEYLINQLSNIGALSDIIKETKKDSPNSAIAAIRARAELYDRLLTKGQECGVFAKVPDRKVLSIGVAFQDLTTPDIKIRFAQAVADMARMMKRFGDHTIIDAPVSDLHYGEALADEHSESDDDEAEVKAPPTKYDAVKAVPKATKTARARNSKSSKHARGRKAFRVIGGA